MKSAALPAGIQYLSDLLITGPLDRISRGRHCQSERVACRFLPSGIKARFDVGFLVLINDIIPPRQYVVRCPLKHCQFLGYGSQLGYDLNSCGASSDNGYAFPAEVNRFFWPTRRLVPFSSIGFEAIKRRLFCNRQRPSGSQEVTTGCRDAVAGGDLPCTVAIVIMSGTNARVELNLRQQIEALYNCRVSANLSAKNSVLGWAGEKDTPAILFRYDWTSC